MRDPASVTVSTKVVALAGNPNSGKTTVFNALTGLRHKVGNYPGVTVEKREGRLDLDDNTSAVLLDLPGTYSLHPNSPDERVASDILLGRSRHAARPACVLCIVDAVNLERGLYLVSQLLDQQIPMVIGLTMVDIALREGLRIDHKTLARELGVPVIPVLASRGQGVKELRHALRGATTPSRERAWRMPDIVEQECKELADMLVESDHLDRHLAFHEALHLLTSDDYAIGGQPQYSPAVLDHLVRDREKLEFMGINRNTVALDARYSWIHQVTATVVTGLNRSRSTSSDRIDRLLTHRFWGIVIFLGIMALMFQSVFTWAELPMEWIGAGFNFLASTIRSAIPPGDFRDLLVDGALAGVASVVMFLPQILLLFFFLGLLEDTGYMARAALIMDRFMSRFGLHGKSFIPLLSSFACAIPGIMATRTIENQRDRLVTMLVAPLMSCSARLPVYSLLIAATIPPIAVLGIVSLPALTLFGVYFLGLAAALIMATVFKKTLLRGTPPGFYMELPPYRLPGWKSIGMHMWERALVFLKNAGSIILGASILLWFLATYPKLEEGSASEKIQYSFAGRMGRSLEPVIQPLGFDWKIGVGLVSSIFQREIFVSTMSTIYNVQDKDDSGSVSLRDQMKRDRDPMTGRAVFGPLTGISLMVFYVFAMQCLSTVAVMRRETNSWRWPLFQIAYMTALAYSATFVVYRIGLSLGIS